MVGSTVDELLHSQLQLPLEGETHDAEDVRVSQEELNLDPSKRCLLALQYLIALNNKSICLTQEHIDNAIASYNLPQNYEAKLLNSLKF